MQSKHARGWWVLWLLLVPAALSTEVSGEDLLFRGASLVSASGVQRGVDVLVRDGRIAAVGSALDAQGRGVRVVDVQGRFITPGLIDCHTHLRAVPGALLRGDGPEAIERAQRQQLRAYVAAGVTSVLDAAAPESQILEFGSYVERTNLGPRIYNLAPFFTPEGGYFGTPELRSETFADLWPAIGADLERIDRHFERAAPLGAVGAKVTVEDGFGPIAVWPVFDDKTLEALLSAAKRHESALFVHALTEDEYEIGLRLEPRAFVHGVAQGGVSDALLETLRTRGTYVIATIAISEMVGLMWEPERLAEPWIQRLVPAEQLEAALDEENIEEVGRVVSRSSTPRWVPDFIVSWIAAAVYGPGVTDSQLENAARNVLAMYEAGVPIVMGSDAGNWPLWLTMFHGVGAILELEALERAGLPREAVLAAATTRAAEMLGKGDEIGALEVGQHADLVVLGENPLEVGMRAFREPLFVMKAGELRTPEDWMTQPSGAQ